MGPLEEALLYLDREGQARLRFAYCLNLAGYLALSGWPGEAERLMPEDRELAFRLRNEVELTRTLRIQGWIDLAAGGRREAQRFPAGPD